MKYCSTYLTEDGREIVHVVLPLSKVPSFDPEKPYKQTYGCPDEVEPGYLVVHEGESVKFVPYNKTQEELNAEENLLNENKLRQRLDIIARSKGYDNASTLSSYAVIDAKTEATKRYKQEAIEFLTFMAECWELFYASNMRLRSMPPITLNWEPSITVEFGKEHDTLES